MNGSWARAASPIATRAVAGCKMGNAATSDLAVISSGADTLGIDAAPGEGALDRPPLDQRVATLTPTSASRPGWRCSPVPSQPIRRPPPSWRRPWCRRSAPWVYTRPGTDIGGRVGAVARRPGSASGWPGDWRCRRDQSRRCAHRDRLRARRRLRSLHKRKPAGGDCAVAQRLKADPLPNDDKRVGMVFQHFELFPHVSVTENLLLAPLKVLG